VAEAAGIGGARVEAPAPRGLTRTAELRRDLPGGPEAEPGRLVGSALPVDSGSVRA
jgi:hypothetical protein